MNGFYEAVLGKSQNISISNNLGILKIELPSYVSNNGAKYHVGIASYPNGIELTTWDIEGNFEQQLEPNKYVITITSTDGYRITGYATKCKQNGITIFAGEDDFVSIKDFVITINIGETIILNDVEFVNI